MSQAPRDASTLVLLRDAPGGPEIYFVKRSAAASFMGGAFVFPGGRVDPADRAPALQARLSGVPADLTARLGASDEEEARALVIAGLRETFEEAGVLLARGPGGGPADLADPARAERAALARARLIQGDVRAFAELLDELVLTLDAGAVAFFSRWITPEVEPKRFDARFFAALAPAAQEASHDQAETTEGRWLSAAEAIRLHHLGEVFLAPPTFRTLEGMLHFTRADELVESLRAAPAPVVRPFMRFDDNGGVSLLLDHDPEHPSPGAGPYLTGPSRIVLHEGRWWSRAQ